MIEAASITLRESIEAILVIFIMTAYLDRTNDKGRKKYVYRGALVAITLSIVFAFILSTFGIDPENEVMEGSMYWVAAILVSTLVIWMTRHAKHFKNEIEGKMSKAGGGMGLAVIAFAMVFREGAETVIFLQSLLVAGTTPLQNFLGGLVGLALAILFGAVFLRGTARINLSRFFKITTAILLVLAFDLFMGGMHEFFEAKIFPSTRNVLAVVGFFKRDSTNAVIIALMLLALILTVLYDMLKAPQPDLSALKPAARRKARYNFMKEKYTKAGLASVITVLAVLLLTPAISGSGISVPDPIKVTAHDNLIKVAVPPKDGFYRYDYNGARFLMVVKDHVPHVALDACYICPKVGYGFDGKEVVCLNCNSPVLIESVGRPGASCNPKVIKDKIEKDTVTVYADALLDTWKE